MDTILMNSSTSPGLVAFIFKFISASLRFFSPEHSVFRVRKYKVHRSSGICSAFCIFDNPLAHHERSVIGSLSVTV